MAESKSTRRAAIVLAAGAGTRFGGGKLTALYQGRPLVAWALDAALAAPVSDIVVAIGDDPFLEQAVHEWDIHAEARVVKVAEPARGMGASLAAAARAVPADVDGLFVFLGDMPRIGPAIAPDLALALPDRSGVVAPVHRGRRGHPVLFGGDWLPALRALDGDVGAQALLRQAGSRFVLVETDEPGVLFDVDRREDLES
jgi:molybdenum cofactor cytidylyltransferase